MVSHVAVSHDRGRVGVDQDNFDAFFSEVPAGLGPGIVELSSRLGILVFSHHFNKAVKEVFRVVRAAAGFRVELDGLDVFL